MFGILGFLILILLPGSWITYGLRLSGLQFWTRFLLGTVLSPIMACVQFYILRLVGIPFTYTVILLPIINLPTLYLIYKHRENISLPDGRWLVGWVVVLLVPLVFLLPALVDTQGRLFTGHSWMYSDPTYLIANGSLVLEESGLAGLRLAYPWFGLVYQAILSFLIDSPPAISYVWTNMFWLLFIFAFVAKIVSELGGNQFSRKSSAIWLAFGVNFVGFILLKLASDSEVIGRIWEGFVRLVRGTYPLDMLGDPRYSPWILKFLFFEQEPLALGIFAALTFLLVQKWDAGHGKDHFILIGLLICGLGILYTPLFPAAVALIAARMFVIFLQRDSLPRTIAQMHLIGLGIGLILSGIVTMGYLSFLTVDRVTSGVNLAVEFGPAFMLRKAITGVVVTLPMIISLVLIFPKLWKMKQTAIMVLSLGALASILFTVVFYLPGFGNEYKFIFTAAICLAPFPSLALEPLMDRLQWKAWPVFITLAILLALSLVDRLNSGWPWFGTTYDSIPVMDISSFELRLDSAEFFSGITDAIRQRTPPNTILALRSNALHFPTLTSRSLYAPPYQSTPNPGVNIISDDFLGFSRGYGKQIIEDRRQVLNNLFSSINENQISNSLNQLLEFKRPIAIILDEKQDSNLFQWLVNEGKGSSLYEGNGLILWLVQQEES